MQPLTSRSIVWPNGRRKQMAKSQWSDGVVQLAAGMHVQLVPGDKTRDMASPVSLAAVTVSSVLVLLLAIFRRADTEQSKGKAQQGGCNQHTSSALRRRSGVHSKLRMNAILASAASVYNSCCSLVMCCRTICGAATRTF